MKTVKYNDGIASRGRSSRLVFYVQELDFLVLFNSCNVRGLCQILNRDYEKNGKWSNTTYEIAIPDSVFAYRMTESFGNGLYFDSDNWQDAYNQFINNSKFEGLSFEAFKTFVKREFNKTYARFETTELALADLGNAELLAALYNVECLKKEIAGDIFAERKRIEMLEKQELERIENERKAKELNQKLESVKKIYKKGLPLEMLQDLYNQL